MSSSSSNESAPFSELVREGMRARGLGLRELCRAAELDPSFLSKVLAGKRNPPGEEDVLRRLAGVLGLSAPRLVASAGRIPAEWARVRSDEEAFRSAHSLITGERRPAPAAVPQAPRPSRGWRSEPLSRTPPPPPAAGRSFGEELL